MKNLFLIIQSCLFLMCLTTVAYSDSDSVIIGGVTLTFDMSLTEVKNAFEKSDYQLKDNDKLRKNRIFTIVKKKSPFPQAGSISFDNDGKLISIDRDWGSFYGDQALEIGRALYNCFNQEKSPIASTLTDSSPKSTNYSIALQTSDNRTILITIWDGKKLGKAITIQEHVIAK